MAATVEPLAEVESLLRAAVRENDCLALVLSQPDAAAGVEFTKVSLRPVVLSRGPALQATYRFPRKETHENLAPDIAADKVCELFPQVFRHAHLFTAAADYEFRKQGAGQIRVRRSAPTRAAVDVAHDRTKQYLIPEGVPNPFLIEIGVMTPAGQVRAAKYHKFRQINRFIELVDDVLPHLPPEGELHVVDFGSGKSYLTFALHHLLTGIRGRSVRLLGIDRNAEVVADCRRVAALLGCAGLEFHTGDIGSAPSLSQVDLAVSLHACDTATDDALAQAVRWEAPVILAVPCCQHELAPLIHNETLRPLTDHGIIRERFASLATDALRALALDLCGYQTQIVEFIDMEHTPKNLMIRAVRHERPPAQLAARAAEYVRYKAALGLDQPYLERILGGTFAQQLEASAPGE